MSEMCKAMEELRDESYAEGKLDQKIEMAWNLYDQGISTEQIAKASKVDVNTVKVWLTPKAV